MIKPLVALLRSLFRLETFRFQVWETVWLRLVFAWLLLDSLPNEAGIYPGTPHPRGLAHFMNLSFMHDAGTVKWLSISATITLLIGAVGIAEPLTLGWTLLVICMSKSYNVSQGALGHAGQLHTLCLLAWWLASLMALRGGWKKLLFAGPSAWSRQVWYMIQTIAASYTVSAITKLVNSGGMWPFKGGNFVLQMMKAHDERLSSSGMAASDFAYQAAAFVGSHPVIGSCLLSSAWMLEFFAFLALLNRRMSAVIGLGLLGFHQSTELLMTIGFATHRQLLWLFLVNPAFWLVAGVIAVRGGGSSSFSGRPLARTLMMD